MNYYTVNTSHKWLNQPDDTLGVYNYWDCISTLRVRQSLKKEQIENSQWNHYRKVYWPLVAPVMAMQKRGLLLNTFALNLYKQQVKQELDSTVAEVLKLTSNKTINLNSPKQRAELLYDELELKCPKTTPTGARSTDQHALDSILRNLRKKDEHALPVIHALFHRSRLNTIQQRYLNPQISSDGRVRPTIKLSKVETLRLAYANPPLQQMPKEVRHIYRASPGHILLSIDYSQLEARILAVLSNDMPSLRAFSAGLDIHSENAQDLFDTPLASMGLSQTRKTRDYAKTFLYGISYGGKSETLKAKLFCPCPRCSGKVPDTLSLSVSARKEAEDRWFSKHPRVLSWRKELVEQVRKDKSYTTAFGYKRFFFAPTSSNLPEIYNCPMQSNAAGLMNNSLVECDKVEVPLVLQMHDELVAEVEESRALDTAQEMKSIMERPIPELGNTIFPVDVAIGPNWGKLEEMTL